MLFSTFQFIFQFLPIVIGIFLLLQRYNLDEFKGPWLLVCSVGFYLFWNPQDLLPLAISSVVNYGLYKSAESFKNKNYLLVGIIFNLLFLAWFKYPALFFKQDVPTIPLGISFYTFTQITFLVDRYSQKFEPISFTKYALFVSYFPHLVCGPILIFKDFYQQVAKQSKLLISQENIAYFLFFFSIGLFKKTFVADPLGLYVCSVFDSTDSLQFDYKCILLAVMCYSLQIYADFSGYSDMAVGLSKLFNISIPFNFNSPYQAESIIEFWRRWHISLSNFLKNYLYVPLGGNRQGKIRQSLNLLLVMTIGGIWHGSSITFLVWGVYHGTLLILNHYFRNISGNFQFLKKFYIFKAILVFILVSIGWIIFRSHALEQAFGIMASILSFKSQSIEIYFTTKWQSIAVVLGIILSFALPETQNIYERIILSSDLKNNALQKNIYIIGTILGFLFALSILTLNKPQQFLYSGF